jgi:NADH:ubiquinone reductase (H+-translocating)
MKKRIVIAGGGFAGLYAAKYLDKTIARHADVEVGLISDENFTLFTPLLHEVAAGDLYPSDIINPLRRILRHVMVVEAEVEAIDLRTRTVFCRAGVGNAKHNFGFDHLLLASGAQPNFFEIPGVRDWAVTMKNLTDASLLRNRMVALLEQATIETDEAVRRYSKR